MSLDNLTTILQVQQAWVDATEVEILDTLTQKSRLIQLRSLNQINMKASQISFVNSTSIRNLVSYSISGFIYQKTYSLSNAQVSMIKLNFSYFIEDLEQVDIIHMWISYCHKILGIYLLMVHPKCYLKYLEDSPHYPTFAINVFKYQSLNQIIISLILEKYIENVSDSKLMKLQRINLTV